MTTLYQAIMLILDVIWFLMIAHIIMSWLINFQVLNLRQPLVAQLWDGLNRLLEPLYRPIRNVTPSVTGTLLMSRGSMSPRLSIMLRNP